jgi:16S rRNA processing protein RimM
MQLVVGRIARPHGIRGEVIVEVRTDDPGDRFAAGSVLATDPSEAGPLTVESARWHSGRLLVRFGGIGAREQADTLRGSWLVVDSEQLPASADPDEFPDYQLIGLAVETTGGDQVGTVTDVLHQGQDLLVVRPAGERGDGGQLLVPFVAAIATEVNVTAGRVVIDPPPGLLELGTGGDRAAGRG